MAEQIITDRRRQVGVIASVAFGGFLISLDSYIVNISLPVIARDFGVGTSAVSGVVLAYLLVLSSTLLLFGKLGDSLGLKFTYLWGYALFTIGSLLCGIPNGLAWLVMARCVQGLGGAMLFAVGPTLIPRFLPAKIRGTAFGLMITLTSLGMTLGNPLGGLLTGTIGWPWVFRVNIPLGIAAMILTWKVLPSDVRAHEAPAKARSFDVPGAAMVIAGLVVLVLALNQGEERGWASRPIVVGLVASAILIALFIRRESRVGNPMLDVRIFRDPDIDYATLSNLFGFIAMAGSNFLMPFYLALIRGLRPEQAGLVLLAYSVVYGLMSPVMGRLSDRHSPRDVCSIGMVLAACACAFFAFTLSRPGLVCTFVYLALLGVAYAMFLPPNNNMVMGFAPAGEIGEVSGMFKTLSNLSLILGVSLYETLFSLHIPAGALGPRTPRPEIFAGCRYALLAGVACCLVALAFNVRIRRSRPT